MLKKAAETREIILYNFDKLVREQGYENTTFRQLSAVCNMSLGKITFHFNKKEDLLLTLKVYYLDKIDILVKEYITFPKDSLAEFLSFVLLDFFIASQFGSHFLVSSELANNLNYTNESALDFYQRASRSLQDAHISFEKDDLFINAIYATKGLYGLFHYWYNAGIPLDYMQAFQKFVSVLFLRLNHPDIDKNIQIVLTHFDKLDHDVLAQRYDKLNALNYKYSIN